MRLVWPDPAGLLPDRSDPGTTVIAMPVPSADALAAAAREILLQRGPMDEDDLLDALDEASADLEPALHRPLSDVLDDHQEPIHVLADDRLAWIPTILDGRTFTHRLTPDEVEHDLIAWNPDLAPLGLLTQSVHQLADGSPISDAFAALGEDLRGAPESVDPGGGVLLLPPRTFAELGAGAGDLVGLGLTAQGFQIETIADVVPSGAGGALTAVIEDLADRPESLDAVVWTVCADDDGAFRQPTAPLSEILAANDLAYDNGWVANSGFDFPAYRAANRIRFIKEQYGLSDDEALTVLAAVHLYDRTLEMLDAADTGDADELVEVITRSVAPAQNPPGTAPPSAGKATIGMALTGLADPIVATVVLDVIGSSESERNATALRLFAESLESMVPRAARPALRWLRAKAFELLGDFRSAEATLEAAESLDESWPLTLMSLARYASDRGNAERGLSLLRRAGMPEDHEMVLLLKNFQPAPRTGLGRNERCFCGSGRKYKVCHLNREEPPLEERAAWLYQKSAADLSDGPFSTLLLRAAAERARYWDFPDAIEHALDEGVVGDAVLFEGGAFEDFLATRGFLLPEDERSLAEQWLLCERSVHEVLDVRRGEGITLRDVRTGDVNDVRDRAASRQVKPGELYCARVVPAGETMQVFGGLQRVPVGPERDGLIALLDEEPGPVDLVAFLSRGFAPAILRNTEGDPLMLCEATMHVEDPAAVSDALDEAYGPHEQQPDGTRTWLEFIVTRGLQRIRAQIDMGGDQVRIQTNSAARFDRVLAAVRDIAPSATVLSETREPCGDARALSRLAEREPAGELPDPVAADDPELAAALTTVARQYEAAWLDEAIPALGGHTPRQCAEDPTRRDDLIRLLDSFGPDTGRPGAMSADRIRAALGLT